MRYEQMMEMTADREIPAWARNERMEYSEPLEKLWGLSDNVERNKNRKAGLRERLAKALYKAADFLSAPEPGLRAVPNHANI